MPDQPERKSTLSEVLLRRHLAGDDPAASARLFMRLRKALKDEIQGHPYYHGLQRIYDRDDVLQELWEHVFRSGALDRFEDRGPGSLLAFLLRALDCLMVDLQRREHAEKRGGGKVRSLESVAGTGDSGAWEPPAAGPGPGSVLVLGDWLSACEDALEGEQKIVWQLRVREGLDGPGIARRLGKSDSAVRGLLFRALRLLAEKGLLEGWRPDQSAG